MRVKKSIFLSILIAILFLPLCFWGQNTTSNSQVEKVGVVANIKSYEYSITENSAMFTINGKYTNGQTYFLASGFKLGVLIAEIDEERETAGYPDCVLNFGNIIIGNDNIQLANGNYTIKGQLTGNLENTDGFITLAGASVVFDDANVINNGLSALVKNTGSGSITINGGNYEACTDVIVSTSNSNGSITINYGTIKSTTGYAIYGVSTDKAEININEQVSKTTLITSPCDDASIYLKKGQINITGGKIENTGASYTIKTLETANIALANTPIFTTSKTAKLSIQSYIDAQIGTQPYSSTTKLNIEYAGSDIESNPIVIKNITTANYEKFYLTNTKHIFVKDDANLIIKKYFKITYNIRVTIPEPCVIPTNTDITNQQKQLFFTNDTINLIFLASDLRQHFTFLGWSTNKLSVNADYAEGEVESIVVGTEDINLFAIWKATEYSITYDYAGGVGTGVEKTSYTFLEEFTIANPTKPYYYFVGWKQGVNSLPQNPFKVVKGTFNEITITAVWNYLSFDIEYKNIPLSTIQNNNLKTSYTIADENKTWSLSDFYGGGYSTYGMFLDEDLSVEFDGEICFDVENNTNSAEFNAHQTLGETITIYIDTKQYQNGAGLGSKEFPYILETETQLNALLTGHKDTSKTRYIKLANNLTFANVTLEVVEPLTNIVLDGDNKTITITAFNKFNNYIALFPFIKNCEIKNASFETNIANYDFSTLKNIQFGTIVGLCQNSQITNVNLISNITFTNTATTEKLSANLGGMVCDLALNSIVNYCTTSGEFNINFTNTHNVDLYVSGLCSCNYSSLIINCQNAMEININVVLGNDQCEAIIFASGIANMERYAKIYNTFNTGKISAGDTIAKRILLSGIANIFNIDCVVKNCFNLGEFEMLARSSNDSFEIVWTNSEFEKENLFALKSSEHTTKITQKQLTNGTLLDYLNKNLKTYNKELNLTNVENNFWYFDAQSKTPQFSQSILVVFNMQGILPNRTEFYTSTLDISKKVFPNTYRKYFFEGWYLNKDCTIKTDLTDISEFSSLTLYAKFVPLEKVVNDMFIIYIVVDILLLAGLFVALYFFDRKKSVKFYSNGKLIAEAKYGRAKTIQLPNEFENMLWFEDIQGQKPFINRKMPHKAICLYTFNESKQKRMESKYYKELEDEQQRKLEISLAKADALAKKEQEKQIRKEEQLQIQKQKKEEKLAKIEQQRNEKIARQEKLKQEKLAKEQERIRQEEEKRKEEEEKAKQTEITIDDHITVIKKEIKVIKNNKKDN